MKNNYKYLSLIISLLVIFSLLGRSHIIKYVDIYSRDSDIRSYIIASAKILIPLKDNIFMMSLDDKINRLKSSGACIFCDLANADLTNVKLKDIDFRYSNLSGADLSGLDLSGVNLRGVTLKNANLSSVNLNNSNIDGVDLTGADLSGADLSGADLSGADLSGVDLSGLDLSGVDLSGVDLSGADLSGADLNNTLLIDTNLTGTNLFNTDIGDADLTGAVLKDSKKVQIKFKNIDDPKWPSFHEMKELGIKGNVGRYEDINYLRGAYFNISNFFLSEDSQFLTTKEGFLYKLNDDRSELSLNLNQDAQFPFTDVGYNAGLLDVTSNNEFIYISYTSKGDDFIDDGVNDYSESIESFSSLIVDEYSLDFEKVRNVIKIDGFLPTHYGGALEFDSAGRLYLSTGDGGPHPDTDNHAQNLQDLRGKILRIDLSESKRDPEIVAFGLRNPFGVIIDAQDRMFVNVCGSDAVETVYMLKDLNSSPYNLGWPVFSGTMRMRPNDPLLLEEILRPIFEYKIRPGCATGGVIIDSIKGKESDNGESYYLFSDFYGTLRILKEIENGEWELFYELKQEKYIYNLSFDRKTKKIIVSPYILELDVLIEPILFEEEAILCKTTMPNGLIDNSDCDD